MIEKQIENFRNNPATLSHLTTALSLLHQSGILSFLRDLGRVRFVTPNTPNYSAVQASTAAESWGYNQALDNLVYFRELFLEPNKPQPDRVNDLYGSLDRATESGDLTEGEANAIRTNSEPPEPTVITWDDFARNIPPDKQ